MAGTAPTFAGTNGTDYLNYTGAARRGQSSLQAPQLRAERQEAWANARAALPRTAPEAGDRPTPHRYYGGPKSMH
ncbi:MAG: hypothetical protein EKK33_07405 [Bradyrhizobiaceae bacterium]|nr:MAG: hypothetical protein EKK33_07405 [Bradyrhizobiaceae bacterium]